MYIKKGCARQKRGYRGALMNAISSPRQDDGVTNERIWRLSFKVFVDFEKLNSGYCLLRVSTRFTLETGECMPTYSSYFVICADVLSANNFVNYIYLILFAQMYMALFKKLFLYLKQRRLLKITSALSQDCTIVLRNDIERMHACHRALYAKYCNQFH